MLSFLSLSSSISFSTPLSFSLLTYILLSQSNLGHRKVYHNNNSCLPELLSTQMSNLKGSMLRSLVFNSLIPTLIQNNATVISTEVLSELIKASLVFRFPILKQGRDEIGQKQKLNFLQQLSKPDFRQVFCRQIFSCNQLQSRGEKIFNIFFKV